MSSSPTPSPSPTPCYYGQVCPYLKYNGSIILSNHSPTTFGIYDGTTNRCVYNYTGTTNLNSINTLQLVNPYNLATINGKNSNNGSTPPPGSTATYARTWTVNCPSSSCSSYSNTQCW
jgi:hypothetical protein